MHKMTQPKLYTRGNKLWVRFSLDGEVIKKSLNIEDSKVNRHLANTQIIPQLILKINTGEFFESNTTKMPTVNEYALISFETHRYERKETTIREYKSIYNKHIKPYFGDKKLDKIRVSDINIWKNKLFSEVSLSSNRVNHIKKVLGAIIEDAVRDEIILSNPVRKSKPLPIHQQAEIEPFSLEEIDLILSHATGQDKNIIATLFMTGMRTGELIGLKWSDISFKQNEISIKRTIGRGIESTPKTVTSTRVIPILNSLLKYLKDQFEITGEKDSYVFLNIFKTHYFDSKNLRDGLWKKVLKKANVRYRTIYHTRHTFCSINLQNGEDLIWISKILGHKNPKITLERYSKHIPSSSKRCTIFDKLAS
jgi:integrase